MPERVENFYQGSKIFLMKLKKKTKKILFSVFILIAVFIVILLVRLFSPEDTWLCVNGKWIKHGNPTRPMPVIDCNK